MRWKQRTPKIHIGQPVTPKLAVTNNNDLFQQEIKRTPKIREVSSFLVLVKENNNSFYIEVPDPRSAIIIRKPRKTDIIFPSSKNVEQIVSELNKIKPERTPGCWCSQNKKNFTLISILANIQIEDIELRIKPLIRNIMNKYR